MRCPRCDAGLEPQPAGRKATLHACPERHGVFVTEADLAHVLPVAPHVALRDAMTRATPGQAACPQCRASMGTLVPRGVELDGCPACRGVWFDGGELERVKAQPPGPASTGSAAAQRPHLTMGLAGGANWALDANGFAAVFEIIAGFLDGW